MPTKKKQKKSSIQTSKFGFLKHKSIILLLALLAVICAIWLVQYVRVETSARHDRQLLDSVDRQMGKDFNAILAQINEKPTSIKHDKNCTYPNADGDPGPPNCGAVYTAVYESSNSEQASVQLSGLRNIFSKYPAFDLENENDFSIYPGSIKNVYCTIDVHKYSGDKIASRLYGLNSQQGIVLVYDCSKSTKKEIYKVYDYNL